MSKPGEFLRALRPKQWLKNVLVFAAAFAGGRIFDPQVLWPTIITFVLFCIASSSVYLLNDLVDRKSDRLHPSKRLRPIASGTVSVPLAITATVAFVAISLAVPMLLGWWPLAGVLLMYLMLQWVYIGWGKNQVVLDILIVASGFGLRGAAGGAVADLELSQWFVLVLGSSSLFIVAGKRYAEKLKSLKDADNYSRATLQRYTPEFLRFVWTIAATLAVLSYSLWAFQITSMHPLLALASVLPFIAGVLFYALDIERGVSEAPEEVFLRDRGLLVSGLVWVLIFGTAVLLPLPG